MRKGHVTIGVDVGGTKIKAAVIKSGGKLGKSVVLPTEAKSGKAGVLKAIFSAISAVSTEKVGAVGVGIAGLVDHSKGVFMHGPNFSSAFSKVPLASLIRKKVGAPAVIDNDVHCFTLAESRFGSAKRFSKVLGVAIGTGFGGAIVTDGALDRGAHNASGEFGHMTIVAEGGEPCSCGQTGHIEAYVSGTAMSALYSAKTGQSLRATEIEEAANNGDLVAKEIVSVSARMFAVGMANLIQTLDPDIIVVGGGLSRTNVLLGPGPAMVKSLIAFPELRRTPIVRAALGQDASVIGAALITNTL